MFILHLVLDIYLRTSGVSFSNQRRFILIIVVFTTIRRNVGVSC